MTNLNAGSGLRYAIGYADGADGVVPGLASGVVEILPTLAGNAQLSGSVTFYDFQVVLSDFGKASQSWDEGDFDYTGTVDFYDFQAVLSNFGQNSSELTTSELATLNSFAHSLGDAVAINPSGTGFSLVSVPEPVTGGMLACGAILMAARRRRKVSK